MGDNNGSAIRVIHVDDDPEIVQLASTFLEREDDRLIIESAETPEEALRILESKSIDCVISDYQLPEMDCGEFAAAVRERAPGMPFLLFTGRDRNQLDPDLLASTVTAHLRKGSGTDQYGDLADAIVEAVEEGGRVETDGGRQLDPAVDLGGLGLSLAEAVDAIEEALVVLDAEGELTYWNDAVADATGYDDRAIEEMAAADFFVEDDRERVREAIETVRAEGTASVTARVETSTGATVPVSIRASRLPGDGAGDQGVVAVVRDRTDVAAELDRQRDRIEEVAGAVSHDFRNPINVISGRLELARETGDEEHFDALASAVDSLGDLVDDLVALARKGNAVERTDPVDLGAVAADGWEAVDTGDATLSVETDRTVRADRARLRELFEHLFRNAVQHGGDDAAVTVTDQAEGFAVVDNGPGIAEDARENLLEFGESTAREGSGAGLAIARRIAEAHGWTVGIEESTAGGARIEIAGVAGSPDRLE